MGKEGHAVEALVVVSTLIGAFWMYKTGMLQKMMAGMGPGTSPLPMGTIPEPMDHPNGSTPINPSTPIPTNQCQGSMDGGYFYITTGIDGVAYTGHGITCDAAVQDACVKAGNCEGVREDKQFGRVITKPGCYKHSGGYHWISPTPMGPRILASAKTCDKAKKAAAKLKILDVPRTGMYGTIAVS